MCKDKGIEICFCWQKSFWILKLHITIYRSISQINDQIRCKMMEGVYTRIKRQRTKLLPFAITVTILHIDNYIHVRYILYQVIV